jgi:hypothetical protein
MAADLAAAQGPVAWDLNLLHLLTLTRDEVLQFVDACAGLAALGLEEELLRNTLVVASSGSHGGGGGGADTLPELCLVAGALPAAAGEAAAPELRAP